MMKKTAFSLIFASLLLSGCCCTGQSTANKTDGYAIEDYQWELTSVYSLDKKSIDDVLVTGEKPVTLLFDNKQMHVLNACNHISAQYSIDQDQITFDHPLSTKMLCHPQLNHVEQFISKQMTYRAQMHVSSSQSPVMTLVFENGNTLTFSGTLTQRKQHQAQTLSTVFMEISDEKPVCSSQAKGCLKVRKIIYHEDGTVARKGQWYTLEEPIDGYVHQEGSSDILRLNQYTSSATESQVSIEYALDMVVSHSQTVKN